MLRKQLIMLRTKVEALGDTKTTNKGALIIEVQMMNNKDALLPM